VQLGGKTEDDEAGEERGQACFHDGLQREGKNIRRRRPG
jgi:hypothetical protein